MTKKLKKVFLLGAGSSAHRGAPLGKHFLKLVYSYPQLNPRLQNIRQFLERYYGINEKSEMVPEFEEVLSFVDIAIQKREVFSKNYQEQQIIQLKTDLHYLIWKALEFVKDISNEDLHQLFIRSCLDENSSIISLNYDTMIDFSLEALGYDVRYGIDFANKPPDPEKKVTELLKLHGSLNWLYCPGCYSIYHYTYEKMSKIFSQDPELCPSHDIYLKGIIIPPTYIKEYLNPFLNMIWIHAGEVLREADELYFIGCSFSDADMWFKYLLKKSLYLNVKAPEIHVVNPENRSTLRERYERLLGRVNYIEMTFSQWLHSK